jgi:hydrogenase nickel incorporation protein HypA/HybF
MHEYSVAMEVYKAVLNTALKNKATKVTSVDLELGALTIINPEQLAFCFEVVARGSLLEGADLNIIRVAPKIRCECGYEGSVNTEQQAFYDLVLISGREINVRTIKLEVDKNA